MLLLARKRYRRETPCPVSAVEEAARFQNGNGNSYPAANNLFTGIHLTRVTLFPERIHYGESAAVLERVRIEKTRWTVESPYTVCAAGRRTAAARLNGLKRPAMPRIVEQHSVTRHSRNPPHPSHRRSHTLAAYNGKYEVTSCDTVSGWSAT